MSTLGFSW